MLEDGTIASIQIRNMYSTLSPIANRNESSFVNCLLNEISSRIELISFIKSLCNNISIDKLNERSGSTEICIKIIEPFFNNFESTITAGFIPQLLKQTILALSKFDNISISPKSFLAYIVFPHIKFIVIKKNNELLNSYEHNKNWLNDDQMYILINIIRDMLNLSLGQDIPHKTQNSLSEHAALSRSKWLIER